MDQRRLITFLLLALAVLMFWQMAFGPRPAQRPPPPPAAGGQAGQDQAGPQNGQPGEGASAEGQPPAAAGQPPAAGGLPPIADANLPTEYRTLGSLDPETGYRMLVTLTSRGAAVRRAEMSDPRYADQHDRSGYLGELELSAVAGGVKVAVVGAGTPAAKAGIKPGDVIVGIDGAQGVEIKSPDDLRAALAKTKPGQPITLQVRRGNSPVQPRTVTLIRQPFAVLRPEIENYWMRDEKPPADFVDPPSLLVTLVALNGKPLEDADVSRLAEVLEAGNWEVADRDASSVTFRRKLPESHLELTKRYTLQPAPPDQRKDPNCPAYHLQLDIELKNTADVPQQLTYRLDGPTGMPTEGWWYARKISQRWSAAGMRDVAVRFEGGKAVQITCSRIVDGKEESIEGRPLVYAGVDGQYFSAVLIPKKAALDETWFATTEPIVVGPKPDKRRRAYANVTCRLTSRSISLAAGEVRPESFQVFIGPKRPELLAEYKVAGNPNYSLVGLNYYGWFAGIARPMLSILHFFYRIVGNYGIAIIMLTVLVRGAMFPLSYKTTKSMARMQTLKPEMDHITEKYKTDMQKRSQAIQELYRKHKINPLGGCLPMLLQFPIFIGLYRSLMVDVELRGSPLFGHAIQWCSNLSAPDMLLDWSSVMPDFVTKGFAGPYLNVLPIVTVVLFLITQKMTMPPATNDQAALQQKMMKYMTVFIGFMFYKVASGLCLYFIASSLWGIAERKLLARAKNQDGLLGRGGAPSTSLGSEKSGRNRPPKSTGNGSAGKKKRPKSRRKR